MQGGVARSFDELEAEGFAFWQAAPPEARLRAMVELHHEAWILGGRHGDAPRFDGSTWGIGRFER